MAYAAALSRAPAPGSFIIAGGRLLDDIRAALLLLECGRANDAARWLRAALREPPKDGAA